MIKYSFISFFSKVKESIPFVKQNYISKDTDYFSNRKYNNKPTKLYGFAILILLFSILCIEHIATYSSQYEFFHNTTSKSINDQLPIDQANLHVLNTSFRTKVLYENTQKKML
ncbi:hypothetical protein [Aquimarina sp. 2201CG14-23]|uniref:hypothetical protein n=1 Tax=Aquimarina mycalae TaxID=3040073 RepID=UPI00247821C8|nr:hypothetical protein [Aquimarina sp. 2201CG14-23]MDH7444070.1 hypothetical protein [Aquimarina sp. 2201CG14-23]